MSVLPKRTITTETPVKMSEVGNFVDAITVGDKVTASLPFKKYTSTTNFSIIYKTVKATVTAKLPFLVKTDIGVFTWNEFLLGYYGCGTTGDDDVTEIPVSKKSKAAKNKAA